MDKDCQNCPEIRCLKDLNKQKKESDEAALALAAIQIEKRLNEMIDDRHRRIIISTALVAAIIGALVSVIGTYFLR